MRKGSEFAVAEFNGMRHVHAAICPERSDLRGEAENALTAATDLFSKHGAKIVQQNVFLRDLGQIPFVREILLSHFGKDMPATTYIHQMPCDDSLFSLEAMGVGGAKVENLSEHLATVRRDDITWVYASHAMPRNTANAYWQSYSALEELYKLLASAGARFDQVIRTWLYMGDIVAAEGESQRYKELNKARTDFFDGISFLRGYLPAGIKNSTVYPASTGIGTAGRDICMSALALVTERDDVVTMPLENPRQVAAYDYAKHYSPQSPKFSRAMALAYDSHAITFVSGTASITASETVHIGNAAAQTEETLDNIAALIGEDNFRSHGLPGLGTNLNGLGHARVYVKRPEDYAAIRAVCEKRLGEMPVIYSLGDVCRDDLLVEIEGIAYSRKPAMARALAA